MTNMVTITEERFVELYRKAFETENICRECKDEHTAEEFVALKKERDELMRQIVEIRRAMYVFDRTDRARLEEIEKIIGSEEAK